MSTIARFDVSSHAREVALPVGPGDVGGLAAGAAWGRRVADSLARLRQVQEVLERMRTGRGRGAALDESGGSTP